MAFSGDEFDGFKREKLDEGVKMLQISRESYYCGSYNILLLWFWQCFMFVSFEGGLSLKCFLMFSPFKSRCAPIAS